MSPGAAPSSAASPSHAAVASASSIGLGCSAPESSQAFPVLESLGLPDSSSSGCPMSPSGCPISPSGCPILLPAARCLLLLFASAYVGHRRRGRGCGDCGSRRRRQDDARAIEPESSRVVERHLERTQVEMHVHPRPRTVAFDTMTARGRRRTAHSSPARARHRCRCPSTRTGREVRSRCMRRSAPRRMAASCRASRIPTPSSPAGMNMSTEKSFHQCPGYVPARQCGLSARNRPSNCMTGLATRRT